MGSSPRVAMAKPDFNQSRRRMEPPLRTSGASAPPWSFYIEAGPARNRDWPESASFLLTEWVCFKRGCQSKGLSGFALALFFIGPSNLKDLVALLWLCFGFVFELSH